MKSDVLCEVVDDYGIALVRCGISYNDKGEPLDFIVKEASKLFLDIFELEDKKFIDKSASKVNKINSKDSVSWLSFFYDAYKNAGDKAVALHIEGANKTYKVKSYISDDGLYVTIVNENGYGKHIDDLQQNENTRNTNELYSYIDNAPYGIFISDMLGTIIEANRYLLTISESEESEIIGRNLIEFVDDSDLERAELDLFKKRIDKERFEEYYKCITTKGQIRYWKVSTVKLDEFKFIGFINDVTEKKVLADRISESEREFRMLFNNTGAGVVYLGADGKIILVNRRISDFIGIDTEKINGKTIFEVLPKVQADEIMKRIDKTIRLCETYDYEDKIKNKDGETYVILSTYNCVYDNDGAVGGVSIMFVNITELRKSQNALKESEERFKLLFEDAPLGYMSLSEDGKLISVNKAWLEMLGYEKKEVLGEPFSKFMTKEYIPVFNMNFPKIKHDGSLRVNFEMVKKPGEKIIVRIDWRVYRKDDGTFKQAHCMLQDITQQLMAEQKLTRSEKRYSAMIENISDVIFISDSDRRLKYASPNVSKWLGWNSKDLIGRLPPGFVHPDDYDQFDAHFSEIEKNPGETKTIEFRALCANGEYKNIYLVATNLMHDTNINGILSNFHDITDKVLLEKERNAMDAYVRNQQKLESVGTLASGVAHEINNPINGIMNYSQVILDDLEDSKQIKECAQEIIHETSRVSEIVKNLLGFSRPNQFSFEDAEVSKVLEQTLSLVRTTIKHDKIDLQIEVEENLPAVRCRSSQIQQVIMNLVTNARDSLNAKYPEYNKNKILNINVKKVIKEDKEYIRIMIKDHGLGIPTSVQNRIFDPFFTTKGRDEGTGLGLSISNSIAQEHNGSITFDTKKGEYTRFYLQLPLRK